MPAKGQDVQQSRDIVKNYADHNDPEIIEREIDAAIRDEAERGALLCEQLARIHELGTAKTRKDGSYQGGWLGRQTFVRPNWEKLAQCQEGSAHSLRVVADCIRKGYDPRKLPPDIDERADLRRT